MLAVCVAGARPNFMKVKPVVDGLERRGVEVRLVHTGQHYDSAMSDVFFADLGLRPPDQHLGVGSGTHAEQTGAVMIGFERILSQISPDLVVVVGDVNSTLAAALVAAKAGVVVGHIEAGLRSRDWSMPEEINRVVVDRVSDHLFAPSGDAVDNLRAEGYAEERIHLVGNVMIDTLLANIDRARGRAVPLLERLDITPGRYGVVTLHRPANVDDPVALAALLQALGTVSQDWPLVLPAHPRLLLALAGHAVPKRLNVIPALGYLDFLGLQADAGVVLTDSGGVQEETTVLGVPCLTLRTTTERPITVSEGTNVLVGRDPVRIVAAARQARSQPRHPRRPPLWDGLASDRIADILVRCRQAG